MTARDAGPAETGSVDRVGPARASGTLGTVWERVRGWSNWARLFGALAGLVIGAVLGFYLTMAIVVGQARQGIYVYSLDDLSAFRWQAIPTFLGLVAGTWLGWRAPSTLLRSAAAGVVGALAFAPLGWWVGSWLWTGTSGPWAGAILLAAVGLVVGVAGALVLLRRRSGPDEAQPST